MAVGLEFCTKIAITGLLHQTGVWAVGRRRYQVVLVAPRPWVIPRPIPAIAAKALSVVNALANPLVV